MRTERAHTVIVGAGPAGLTAAHTLSNAGIKPIVVERGDTVGGLMRSLHRGDFIVDIGRKELYNRIERVDRFWSELLGRDYRPYSHRGGLLYQGHIIELSPVYLGPIRGMPWQMVLGCGFDFVRAITRVSKQKPRNVEEFFYQNRGRRMTQIFSQGFQQKLTGRKWADIPVSDSISQPSPLATVRAAVARTLSAKESNTPSGVWKHPALGTGQICDVLEETVLRNGGRLFFNARLDRVLCPGNTIEAIIVDYPSGPIRYEAQHFISSIPIDPFLHAMNSGRPLNSWNADSVRKKSVVLVYLFFDEPPRFPHFWLNVTCPHTVIGRITNYAALNGSMVPAGKTALCCEFYCFDEDPLLEIDDAGFVERSLFDCANLIDRETCIDSLVVRLPGADASQNRHNWLGTQQLSLLREIQQLKNLYYVGRSDLDLATLAGLESAQAILSGDRAEFDEHLDPARVGIRSENKPFEFINPAGYDATLA